MLVFTVVNLIIYTESEVSDKEVQDKNVTDFISLSPEEDFMTTSD